MSYTPAESFVETRARRTDSDTSKLAAKAAASGKAASERRAIYLALRFIGPATARGISLRIGCVDYHTVQRRISEVAGIHKTAEIRDGCRVWAIGNAPCYFDEAVEAQG